MMTKLFYGSIDQSPTDIVSGGCTLKMLNGNDFWWHGPTWLQKDHDDWPTWYVDILSKDIMDVISTENKGPKTIYEVPSLTEEDLADNKQEYKKRCRKESTVPIRKKSNRLFINVETTTCYSMSKQIYP